MTASTIHVAPGDILTVVADQPVVVVPPVQPVLKMPPDTSLAVLATPASAPPVIGSSIIEGTSKLTHVSSYRHSYSRLSAWNRDMSRILLGFAYRGRMIHGTTYLDLGSFPQISAAVWSNVDPNKLYGIAAGNALVTQDARTGTVSAPLVTFSGYTSMSIGGYEGAVSDDDHYIVLSGIKNGSIRMVTYDLMAHYVIADVAAPSGFDNAQISRKGTYIVVVGSFGTRRYSRDLSAFITLYQYGNHGDNALDAAGNEIFVANSTGNGVQAFRLSDGVPTILLPEGSAFGYGHTSGRNLDRPGWVYLSNYNTVITAGKPGRDQIIAVKTDGSYTVEVFGFSHHGGDDGSAASYQRQPQAVPSPDGRRVLFASEWGGTVASAYVAEAV